jgi:hypothetical protein
VFSALHQFDKGTAGGTNPPIELNHSLTIC